MAGDLRLVSFDVWNTLLRLDVIYASIAGAAAKKLGIEGQEALEAVINAYAEAKRARRRGLIPEGGDVVRASREILARSLKTTPEVIESIIDEAFRMVSPHALAIEGALDAVKAVREEGLLTVTIGNVLFWHSSRTAEALDKVGIGRFLDAQIYADMVSASKPDRRIFIEALSRFGVEPEQALHVGDGVVEDFGGALSACMRAALVTPQVKALLSVGPDIHFIPSVKYVPELVRRVREGVPPPQPGVG